MMSGMIAAFSTVYGTATSLLEDAAAAGDLDTARSLLQRVQALAPRLLAAIDGVTIESLKGMSEVHIQR